MKDGTFSREFDGMFIATIVKCWLAGHPKGKRSAYHRHHTNDMMLMFLAAALFNRHEVGDLCNTIDSQEACDQHVCLRQIHLTMTYTDGLIKGGFYLEIASLIGI